MKNFMGRNVTSVGAQGLALVSRAPFYPLKGLRTFLPAWKKKDLFRDWQNKDLDKKSLKGAILCLDECVGAHEGYERLLSLIEKGEGPSAILVSGSLPYQFAVLLATEASMRKIAIISDLGPAFMDAVREGDRTEVKSDGTVVII